MLVKHIDVSVKLPRPLWEQLRGQAEADHIDETTLLIQAIEQFLQQKITRSAFEERLKRECDALAQLDFSDVGTEEEWLVVQNEALAITEAEWR